MTTSTNPRTVFPAPPAGKDLRFVPLFLGIFLALHFLYTLGRGGEVERVVLDVLTVQPAVALINFITPSEQVVAQGHRLVSPQAALSVLGGCEGIEGILLLVAALSAFRLAWQDRLLGMAIGTAFIYALNLLRIMGLYYVFRYQRDWFDIAHAYVGSTVIILLGCLFFLFWANRSMARAE
ncbi:MAG: archaeosortase/exosortase family protein [Pseudomonadota bacterium]